MPEFGSDMISQEVYASAQNLEYGSPGSLPWEKPKPYAPEYAHYRPPVEGYQHLDLTNSKGAPYCITLVRYISRIMYLYTE